VKFAAHPRQRAASSLSKRPIEGLWGMAGLSASRGPIPSRFAAVPCRTGIWGVGRVRGPPSDLAPATLGVGFSKRAHAASILFILGNRARDYLDGFRLSCVDRIFANIRSNARRIAEPAPPFAPTNVLVVGGAGRVGPPGPPSRQRGGCPGRRGSDENGWPMKGTQLASLRGRLVLHGRQGSVFSPRAILRRPKRPRAAPPMRLYAFNIEIGAACGKIVREPFGLGRDPALQWVERRDRRGQARPARVPIQPGWRRPLLAGPWRANELPPRGCLNRP